MENQGIAFRYPSINKQQNAPITSNHEEIIDFDNLRENLTEKLKLDNWFLFTSHQTLHIFNVDKKTNGNLSIRNSICIDVALMVQVFGANDDTIFNLKLDSWPQLQTLIEQFGCHVKRDDDMFVVSAVDGGIDQAQDVATFEFCATDAGNSGYLHPPLTELVEVKIEPNDDTHDLLNNFFHDGSPYICSSCGKAFDQNAKLMEHKRIHETHVCSICNETYTGRKDKHLRQRHSNASDISYQCHLCRQKYVTLHGLEKHLQSKHNPDNAKAKRNDTKKLNDAPLEHKQLEWIQETTKRSRKKNPVFFADNEVPTIEIRSDTKDGTKWSQKCTICDKEFFTKKQFHNHKYRHEKRKWKECDICKRSYDNLPRHMNNVHSNVRNNVCDICGCAYKQRAALKEHMDTKHGKDGDFFCDICKNGKNYRSRISLKNHLKKVHVASQSERFYECDMCDERYTQRYTLQMHKSLEHDGKAKDPQYQCTLCDKKFVRARALINHKKIHTGAAHICPECGTSFNHPEYLRKHRKRHSESKYRYCTMCDKRFVENIELRSHMNKVHGIVVPVNEKNKNKKYIAD